MFLSAQTFPSPLLLDRRFLAGRLCIYSKALSAHAHESKAATTTPTPTRPPTTSFRARWGRGDAHSLSESVRVTAVATFVHHKRTSRTQLPESIAGSRRTFEEKAVVLCEPLPFFSCCPLTNVHAAEHNLSSTRSSSAASLHYADLCRQRSGLEVGEPAPLFFLQL
jgi:hypothetical protein